MKIKEKYLMNISSFLTSFCALLFGASERDLMNAITSARFYFSSYAIYYLILFFISSPYLLHLQLISFLDHLFSFNVFGV